MPSPAEKFLQWLKEKYPLPEVEIILVYIRKPWLHRKGITGSLLMCENSVKIEIACDRDVSRVLQTVPHEYKHILQLFREGIPPKKMKKRYCRCQTYTFDKVKCVGLTL